MFRIENDTHLLELIPASEVLGKRSEKNIRFLETILLFTILGLAAWLRLWGLDQNGTGNPYYAAAVRSMLQSGSNFFFGAFDPTGFVTVDKPPAALWAQALSARIFGFNGLSLLAPQAIMGIASVAVLYGMVRRSSGSFAALLAGFALAITPIAVAVDRDNLPDSMLTLVLIMAAAALCQAVETGQWRWITACVVLVGVGFNVKMLAAFVVLPTFYLIYFLRAPINWTRCIGQLVVATIVLVCVSLSWCLVVEIVPKADRPYIGGSRNNSALDLASGYNGLGRVLGGSGNFGPSGGRAGPPGGIPTQLPSNAERIKTDKAISGPMDASSPLFPNQSFPVGPPGGGFGLPFPGGPGGRGLGGRGFTMFGGPPGLLRFAGPVLAEQITWLFPFIFFGAIASLLQTEARNRFSPQNTAILIWLGWLGTHLFVFSFAQGIFHEYYTIIMGPAVAALTGIGAVALWKTVEFTDWQRALFPTALISTGIWQTYLVGQHPEFRYRLMPLLLGSICVAVTLIVARRELSRRFPAFGSSMLGGGLGLASILVGPAVWSAGTAIAPGMSLMPVADVSFFTGKAPTRPPVPPMTMSPKSTAKLLEFVRANRRGEKYMLAANSSMEVSSLIIESGDAAISLGGFMGADPILTKNQFEELVKDQQLRFVLIGGGPGGGGGPPPSVISGRGRMSGGPGNPMDGGLPGPLGMGTSEITIWVREHGEVVDPKL
jgi:4-amino-4-deoxy-L-arabinose transferase-like glycosyltransferase